MQDWMTEFSDDTIAFIREPLMLKTPLVGFACNLFGRPLLVDNFFLSKSPKTTQYA